MSNKEFINMLIVTGQLPQAELNNANIQSAIKVITERDKFIGNFYRKLINVPNINLSMVFYIISIIVLRYNIDDKYADILCERLRLLNQHLDLSYFTQVIDLSSQLNSNKKNDIKSLLCKCSVKTNANSQESYYKGCIGSNGRPDKVYRLFRINNTVMVTDMDTGRMLTDDLKYILIEKDSRFPIFIDKNEFKNSMYSKHKNLFKIYI